MFFDNRTVVVSGGSASDLYAAKELIRYLRKVAGLRLCLVPKGTGEGGSEVYVGNPYAAEWGIDLQALGKDGYVIARRGNKMLLSGEGTRGTLYAVYAFLERCGVRFYATDCEFVPRRKEIDLPDGFYESYAPVIAMRDVLWSDCYDITLTAKQRVNRSHFRKFTEEVGGGLRFAGYFGHTLGELAETGYDAPEPCLTDENIFQTVLKNVRQRLRDNPGADFVSVSQNDDYRYCTCEKCRAIDEREESHAGTMIHFVNRIADAIKEEFPHVLVHTFAYQYTRKPPKYVRPRDNVLVQLCSIECCFRHPLATCKTPAPAPWMEGTVGDFAEDLRAWHKIAKNIHIWDYTTNFHHYFAPFPNLRVLRENVRFFVENGVSGVLEQGNINSPHSGEFGALKGYLLAKLLYRPDMTEQEYEESIDEFLRRYYGAGWKYIRRYIDGLHDITEDRHIGIYYHPLRILPAEKGIPFMHEAEKLFSEVYRCAASKKQKLHVARSAVQVKYYLQIAEYDALYTNGTKEERAAYVGRNRELYEFISAQSIFMNPDITMPASPDFTLSPDLWHKLG